LPQLAAPCRKISAKNATELGGWRVCPFEPGNEAGLKLKTDAGDAAMKLTTLTALGLSGVLALTAIPAFAAGGEGGPGRGAKMFETADTDGDGAISQAEFEAMTAARFATIDTDGDGLISPEEAQAQGPRGKFGKIGKDPEKRAERAAKMIEAKDTNGDGLLSVEELSAEPNIFAMLDADGDGMISQEEFEEMRGKMGRGFGKQRQR